MEEIGEILLTAHAEIRMVHVAGMVVANKMEHATVIVVVVAMLDVLIIVIVRGIAIVFLFQCVHMDMKMEMVAEDRESALTKTKLISIVN